MASRVSSGEHEELSMITVIMPCFNASNSVARAIASIQAQTLSDWELIVIDDGSTDGSADIADQFAREDSRIRLIRRDHHGVVHTSNHGLSLAQGDFIARMDADDVSRPDRLELQARTLHADKELGAVSCLVHFAGDAQKSGGYAYHVDWANRCVSTKEIELNRFIDLPVPHPSLMFRRSIIETSGAYRDGEFPEDYEMILRWVSCGVKIGKVRETLFDWHDPPSRLSRNDSRYDMAAFHACKAPYLTRAISESGCDRRELWIIGAGRPARKSAEPLEQAWKKASGFVDIDPKKIGRNIHGRPVVSINDLPSIEQAVLVSYVGTRGARDLIREQLIASGRREGLDFWIAC